REILSDIAEQGLLAGEIITGMRAMLRREPEKTATHDLNLLLTTVLEMLRTDLVTTRVTPILRLDPALPPTRGDAVQLRQLLLNLVMNACEAMSHQPAGERTLSIESRRLTSNEVEVAVIDRGSGFPEEILQHVFEPFHTTKAKGLGLGLAICHSIVRAHGGRLVATN